MRGRQPTPVEERVKQGNPGKRPMPETLLMAGRPDADDPMLEPPDFLPAAGKEAWNAVVPTLHEAGLLDRVDRLNLSAMCLSWARAMQAGKVIGRQGHLVKGSNGQLREHPSLKTERESLSMFLKFSEHFALTPVARTRLGLAEIHRRALKAEFESALGAPDLQPIDADAVEDA